MADGLPLNCYDSIINYLALPRAISGDGVMLNMMLLLGNILHQTKSEKVSNNREDNGHSHKKSFLPFRNPAETADWCCYVVPGPLHGARQVVHPARQHHGAAQRHELNRDIVYRETLGHVGFNTFECLSFDYDFISTVVFIYCTVA